MNLSFIKKEYRQKYLIVVFLLAVAATLYMLKKDSLQRAPFQAVPAAVPMQFQPKNIEIDFEFLESQSIKDLRSFEEIKPFEGEVGRENPFIAK